ncbi:amidophosphoribosyltransferase [Clostridium tagluense]|uniref:amidophosphoribosyltransferase n=1 Tax=Clostridium tagluense TaxID=360422 RepID=UPI001CF54A1D|nr:amidophosphoribosyltransferase [Clostridium tagluense]MCB2296205.1 amidophosphoribosyltransferase [Clostridium tagluense]
MQINDADKYKEECGIVGVFSNEEINLSSILYSALNSLQHRGQESCGLTYSDGRTLICHKDMGLVNEVFSKNNLNNINGFSAIGHVRYSTFGESTVVNAQPILDECSFGQIALAHNGNLTNAVKLKKHLEDYGLKFNTSTDSEVILKLIEEHYNSSIEKALEIISKHIEGGYAVVLLTKDKLFAMRDCHGIRPLCIGKLRGSYIVSSESCVLDILGYEFIRDVAPGEIIRIDSSGIETISFIKNAICSTCAFEYIYFARIDSKIDGVSVYNSRFKAGELLFKECPVDADIVIGVPDSGTSAALGYSKASSIPYTLGFAKNNFIGRSFIKPSQAKREEAVSLKLNIIKENIRGKKVVVIDDSMVRGTTCKKIVSLLKEAGAKEIHYRLASPIIKSPCHLGIDTSSKKELIGSNMTLESIRDFVCVDSLGYISIEGFLKTLGHKKDACLKCFI